LYGLSNRSGPQRNVQGNALIDFQTDIRLILRSESLRTNRDAVYARRQLRNNVNAIATASSGPEQTSISIGNINFGTDDNGSRGINHCSSHQAIRGLGVYARYDKESSNCEQAHSYTHGFSSSGFFGQFKNDQMLSSSFDCCQYESLNRPIIEKTTCQWIACGFLAHYEEYRA
jgi:hypothetical protein